MSLWMKDNIILFGSKDALYHFALLNEINIFVTKTGMKALTSNNPAVTIILVLIISTSIKCV